MRRKIGKGLVQPIGLIALALFFIVVATFYAVFQEGNEEGRVIDSGKEQEIEKSYLAKTSGTWDAITAEKAAVGNRSLESFYSRRAFPGAPPIIPHAVAEVSSVTPGDCLSCHGKGGYAPKFKAFAPKTPHPDFLNCRQCHVPQRVKEPFRGTNWVKPERPNIHQKYLVSAPPQIPHELQLRENCMSCHTGPGAVKEIRTSHPERVNCIQCHVPRLVKPEFSRESYETP